MIFPFGSVIVISESQPEIKIKLFGILICQRLMKQHYHSELMRVCDLWSLIMNCSQKIKHISLSA